MTYNQAMAELKQCVLVIEEVEQLRELAEIRRNKVDLQAMVLSDMPSGGSGSKDKIGTMLGQVEEHDILAQHIKEQDFIKKVENRITQIKHPLYRTILRMRYLQNLMYHEIAETLHRSLSGIKALHSQAVTQYSLLD